MSWAPHIKISVWTYLEHARSGGPDLILIWIQPTFPQFYWLKWKICEITVQWSEYKHTSTKWMKNTSMNFRIWRHSEKEIYINERKDPCVNKESEISVRKPMSNPSWKLSPSPIKPLQWVALAHSTRTLRVHCICNMPRSGNSTHEFCSTCSALMLFCNCRSVANQIRKDIMQL